jgi:hypothetical protein
MMDLQDSERRHVLLLGAAIPALAVGEAAAAPGPTTAPSLEFVYEALVTLSPDVAHGRTPYGNRTRAPITGGRFRGPAIGGTIVPGGADWQLLRADGYLVVDATYFMREDDGTQIEVRNRGLWHSDTNDWPADYALTTPVFEVPIGKHDWLNRHVFVGTIGPGPGTAPAVVIRVYRVLMPKAAANGARP